MKDRDGHSNAADLKHAIDAGGGKTRFAIDALHLRLGQVSIKDYSGKVPTTRTLRLDIDASYHDVTDTDVTRLVLLTVLDRSLAPGLGIDTAALRRNLGDMATSADRVAGHTAGDLEQAGRHLMQSLQYIFPRAGE